MTFKNALKQLFMFRNQSLHWNVNVKVRQQNVHKFVHISTVHSQEKAADFKTKEKKPIKVWSNMTVKDLATAMNMPTSDLLQYFSDKNLKPNDKINSLGFLTNLGKKKGVKFEMIKKPPDEEKKTDHCQPPSKPENLVKRPPVVTVMGHVDHGKTTLLDSLRNTFVAQQEFGGITQHIGAFSVEVTPGQRITFIDTPGHAAFTAMRSRGAHVTDIVVLVVAADDGVMEQTVESIRIARTANVPIIVALNKIDKPNAFSVDEVKEKLILEGIQVEEAGGDIQMVPISALKKINLNLLTEVILLEADLLNLKGDPTGLVEGVIIESKKEKFGIVATIIVKRGTLKKQKILVAGLARARVRKMLDENGNEYKEALPSTPVQIYGWKDLPLAGDQVIEVKSEKEASLLIREREKQLEKEKWESDKEMIERKALELEKRRSELKEKVQGASKTQARHHLHYMEEMMHSKELSADDSEPHLKIILKGDVYGSLEVLEEVFKTYDKEDECKVSIVDASVGNVTQTDIENAEIFGAIIYAFNVDLHPDTKTLAEKKLTDIRYHNVLYKLIDDVKNDLNSRIPPKDEEELIGEAEVLQNFTVTHNKKKVFVAGARCVKGELKKESLYKVLRNDEVIYTGMLDVMKNEKTVVKTIHKGMECGLMLNSFPCAFEPGDKIICYQMVKTPRTTSWDPGF